MARGDNKCPTCGEWASLAHTCVASLPSPRHLPTRSTPVAYVTAHTLQQRTQHVTVHPSTDSHDLYQEHAATLASATSTFREDLHSPDLSTLTLSMTSHGGMRALGIINHDDAPHLPWPSDATWAYVTIDSDDLPGSTVTFHNDRGDYITHDTQPALQALYTATRRASDASKALQPA